LARRRPDQPFGPYPQPASVVIEVTRRSTGSASRPSRARPAWPEASSLVGHPSRAQALDAPLGFRRQHFGSADHDPHDTVRGRLDLERDYAIDHLAGQDVQEPQAVGVK